MRFNYGLDEMPPWGPWLVFGLQWFILAVPPLIILGKVVAGLQFADVEGQVLYLQRLSLVTGLTLIAQILWGHRLPLILGPSSVLLVGMIASQTRVIDAIYSSILLGGVFTVLLAVTGLFGKLVRFFTPRVIAVILLLVAVMLTPTILNLIISEGTEISVLANLVFALVMLAVTFLAHRFLSGFWKSSLMLWSLIAGWLTFTALFGFQNEALTAIDWGVVYPGSPELHFTFDSAVFTAFLICFLALSLNDLGSMQAVGEIVKPPGMKRRITRGLSVTGFGNIVSGLMGVIGPVNFSGSPGVIVSSNCASRFTLIPAALGLIAAAFIPAFMGIIAMIPSVVVAVILIYIMSMQLATGLLVAVESMQKPNLENLLVIGLPLMLGTVIAFLPAEVVSTFPAAMRPLLGNGFIIGLAAALFMEHVVLPRGDYRNPDQNGPPAAAADADHSGE
ncbi:MAG: purine/pyrimidine permease [Syntrophomonadaceae bacterium]|jgi:xanthine/uracil permease|nr:purine/pyrimidine permease [Syntrophomonadaceae bacterium]